MKTLVLSVCIALSALVSAQGYKPGDKATDFSLKNIDGKMVSMKDYTTAKGFIVVFTCNHCPFAKAYEQRILDLDKKYASKGFPVIAINPNDPVEYQEDSYENMQARAKLMNYTFPYLVDASQEITKAYGAAKTPHVYVLKKNGNDAIVEYIGAIDDNDRDASAAKEKYVENAIDALLKGDKVAVSTTKAIGCSIKWKKS